MTKARAVNSGSHRIVERGVQCSFYIPSKLDRGERRELSYHGRKFDMTICDSKVWLCTALHKVRTSIIRTRQRSWRSSRSLLTTILLCAPLGFLCAPPLAVPNILLEITATPAFSAIEPFYLLSLLSSSEQRGSPHSWNFVKRTANGQSGNNNQQ
jgi:hypothetical protein